MRKITILIAGVVVIASLAPVASARTVWRFYAGTTAVGHDITFTTVAKGGRVVLKGRC